MYYLSFAVTAAGFAPLELEGEEDAERYDFQFEWNDDPDGDSATSDGVYELKTLYERGYEGWIAEDSAGDAEFRDAFQEHFPETDYSVEASGNPIQAFYNDFCLLIKNALIFLFILSVSILVSAMI